MGINIKITLLISLSLAAICLQSSCREGTNMQDHALKADVVIYGGTAAAVTAAVQVVELGRSALIVSPDKHLGGLTASGLGFTDTGDKSVIGGLSREFYRRVYQHYQEPEAWLWQKKEEYGNVGQGTEAMDEMKKTMWIFEPHVAEKIFESFITEYEIPVIRDEWLDRENGVEMVEGRIRSISTLGGQKYEGKLFIDATYEGDLMAAAGVRYHVGRESNAVYGEQWNGIQKEVFHHGHHFGNRNISPYIIPGDPSSGVLPRISTEDPGENGEGDSRIQAYCFRTCLTKHEPNRIPFKRPASYDSSQYELLLRVYDSGWRETFNKFDTIPNLKTDVNNHGPFSFDNIGINYDYPEASYERRREIIREHEDYQQGLLYFIANDLRIPEEVRDEMKKWGLSKDEFRDNGNWPHQIYVREARRMVGEFIMTENEILGKNPVSDPIGMGSYTMDSHNTQRYITSEGYVQNEGDIGVHPGMPYQISMGSIIPEKEACTNLLVPVAVSSSHIAFGSIRMEPVFMILGQSAGVIAAKAIENEANIQDLDYNDIRSILDAQEQILEYPEQK
jgi:hypothetical protein